MRALYVVFLTAAAMAQADPGMRPQEADPRTAQRLSANPSAAQTATVKTGIRATGKAAPKKATKAAKPAPIPEPPPPEPTPQQPVVPLRPSQLPAVPPRVSFEAGQLTVVAENCTFADILAAIRQVTGTKIETVGGPGGERVAAKIGPASVRDVLVTLLEGSRYDFVILAAESDPGRVDRVILTPKAGGADVQSASAGRSASQPQGGGVFPQPQAGGDEVDAEDENEGFAPANQPVPVEQQQQQQPAQVAPGQTQGQPQGPAKTPEQLLEELRRLEQERQQQQDPNARPPRNPR